MTMDALYYWVGFFMFWVWAGMVAVLILAAVILHFIPAPSERRAAKIDGGAV